MWWKKTKTLSDIAVLAEVAPLFRERTQAKTDAKPVYDMMSDALVWSDELDSLRESDTREGADWACIRRVWHYRTTLIMQSPSAEHAAFWNRAVELFPEWIGFLPERRDPRAELQELVTRSRSKANLDMDRLFRTDK